MGELLVTEGADATMKFICDVPGCGGEVKATGESDVVSYGTLYKHKCEKCGQDYSFTDKKYPIAGMIGENPAQ